MSRKEAIKGNPQYWLLKMNLQWLIQLLTWILK